MELRKMKTTRKKPIAGMLFGSLDSSIGTTVATVTLGDVSTDITVNVVKEE